MSPIRRSLQAWLFDPLSYTFSGFFPPPSDADVRFYAPLTVGKPGDPLPDGYVNYRADRGHLAGESRGNPRYVLVGREGCWGLRWHYGPLWFEKYVGDAEPEIEPGGPRRIVIWQPMRRVDAPAGWKRSESVMNVRLSGFAEVAADEYWKTWSSHARRHRAKWLSQAPEWEAFTPPDQDFLAGFEGAQMDGVLKALFSGLFKESRKAHGEGLEAVAFRRKGSSSIEAAFACVDVPGSRQSVHLTSYIHASARETSVGHGMMDWWFRRARAKGQRFLDFDRFWAPGEPPSWKGFSRFKAQFGVRFVRWPYPLVRWAGTWREALRIRK